MRPDRLDTAPQARVGQPNAVPESRAATAAAVVRPSGPTCDQSGRQVGPDEEPDWPDLVRFDGRYYYLHDHDGDVRIGEGVGVVRCRLLGSGTPRGYEPHDGDAAYLEVGTTLHRVVGRPLAEAIAARHGTRTEIYEPEP
jgi:hypothetical protein